MGFTLAKMYQAKDPISVRDFCVDKGLRIDHFWGLANHFFSPLTVPGTGKMLVDRSVLKAINLADKDDFRTLSISDNSNDGITLKKVVIVDDPLCVTPGFETDTNAAYLISLSDPRWFHWNRGTPITKNYNLRTDFDGSLVTSTLNAGVAWPWQTMLNDLWPTGLGTA